jgi:hypothetical protein
MIDQFTDYAHYHRKGNILFIINFGEETVGITDCDKNQSIKTKRSGIKQIHQQSGSQTIDHPGQIAVKKPKRKGQNQ